MRNFVVLLLVFAATAMAASMLDARALHITQRNKARANGFFNRGRWKRGQRGECVDGKSDNEYSCNNIDMLDFISHEEMGSTTREGNDLWGWTAPDGQELALVGQTDGTAFVRVEPTGELNYVGRLPSSFDYSIWRDIKTIGDYAYIGSEARGHGLQIFDLKRLLPINETSVKFDEFQDVTALWRAFGSSHNIVANEATSMIYVVGTDWVELPECQGGLYMLNVTDPANPTSPGCAGEDGYVHDAQCVVYTGPDTQYSGHEICFGYNEETLTVYDVTKKSQPRILSRTAYDGATYVHQGWLVDSSMEYLLLDDEMDEHLQQGPAVNGQSTTYIFDVSSLSSPKEVGHYQSPAHATDHNQYIVDGKSYQANYQAGLRIVDISSIYTNTSVGGFKELGYFDVHPEDDAGGGGLDFLGAWSVYPFFKSGNILVNSIERGLFSVKYTGG